MIITLFLCLFFVSQGCHACCWAEKQVVPKSVRKILVLEEKRKTASNIPALEKKISKALVRLSGEDYQSYLAALVPNDAEIVDRITRLNVERGGFKPFAPSLIQVVMGVRYPEALEAQEQKFYVKRRKRFSQIAQANTVLLGKLSLEGYKTYLTDQCDVLVCNDTVLALEKRKDLAFPPEITHIILGYMPERVPPPMTLVLRGMNFIDSIKVNAPMSSHIFADVSSRQDHAAAPYGPSSVSITFISQEELKLLLLLCMKGFDARYLECPGLHPRILAGEVTHETENERLDKVRAKYNISRETIELVKQETFITVPSAEEILLMKDRAENAFYAKAATTFPLAYRYVKLNKEEE